MKQLRPRLGYDEIPPQLRQYDDVPSVVIVLTKKFQKLMHKQNNKTVQNMTAKIPAGAPFAPQTPLYFAWSRKRKSNESSQAA